jgi:hypothetical protein
MQPNRKRNGLESHWKTPFARGSFSRGSIPHKKGPFFPLMALRPPEKPCERLCSTDSQRPRDAQRDVSNQEERKRAGETERDLAQESKGVGQNIITKQYISEAVSLSLLEHLAQIKPINLSKSCRQAMKRDGHLGRRGETGITREPLFPGQTPMRPL